MARHCLGLRLEVPGGVRRARARRTCPRARAGFTPAALTHLADIAEEQGADRGAVMGLYSVFFGLGQVTGALLGGFAGDRMGADGLIIMTGILTTSAFFSVRMLDGEDSRPPGPVMERSSD